MASRARGTVKSWCFKLVTKRKSEWIAREEHEDIMHSPIPTSTNKASCSEVTFGQGNAQSWWLLDWRPTRYACCKGMPLSNLQQRKLTMCNWSQANGSLEETASVKSKLPASTDVLSKLMLRVHLTIGIVLRIVINSADLRGILDLQSRCRHYRLGRRFRCWVHRQVH